MTPNDPGPLDDSGVTWAQYRGQRAAIDRERIAIDRAAAERLQRSLADTADPKRRAKIEQELLALSERDVARPGPSRASWPTPSKANPLGQAPAPLSEGAVPPTVAQQALAAEQARLARVRTAADPADRQRAGAGQAPESQQRTVQELAWRQQAAERQRAAGMDERAVRFWQRGGLGAFEVALASATAGQERIARLDSMGAPEQDRRLEAARRALGNAIDAAELAGLVTGEQALRMLTIGGIAVRPLDPSDVRALLADALAQATLSGLLSPEQASAMASSVATGPATVVAPPEDLGDLRELAVRAAAASDAENAGALMRLLWTIPSLVDRIGRLEGLVYEALRVRPCHDPTHELHLQAPTLCAGQATGVARAVMDGLGIDGRLLPRDTHREPNGERSRCCREDGRVGTWLVHGQYVSPDLKSGRERRSLRKITKGGEA